MPDQRPYHPWVWIMCLFIFIGLIAVAFAIGAFVAALIAALQTDNVLEWHEKGSCGASDNPCVIGKEAEHNGCQYFHKKTGAACESPCFRPEEECESNANTHKCLNTHDGWGAHHECVGSHCYGTCTTANDCPALTNVTVEFLDEITVGPFSFGFNVTCELQRCVYEFDVAVIPVGGDSMGCTSDPNYNNQCMGILDRAEPFAPCLESTAICRRNGPDGDDTLQLDACRFEFKCARAIGLPQFNILF